MRTPRILISAALVLGLFASALAGQLQTVEGASERVERFEHGLLPPIVEKGEKGRSLTLLERMDELGIPGLSVAVIDHGEIVAARGYGVLDLVSKRPVTPQTLFLAGSISKPVAATAALRLVQDGALTLDGDVNQWLRSWQVPPSDALGENVVTLRALLTHTAGLTVHGFPGYARTAEVPSVPQILDGESPANTAEVRVDLEPGTTWRYSGGGYTVMQLLVADVTAKPFEQYAAKTVLVPFGMSASSFENPLSTSRHPLAATGYYPEQRKVKGDWHIYPEMAAAGLWTTSSDLARFAIGIQQAAAGTSSAVLNQDTAQAMLTEHLGSWGLGPSLSGEGATRRFGHGGRDQGFDAHLTAFVEQGRGAALMINTNDNNGFLGEVVASIARSWDWPGFPETEQKEYVVLPEEKLREYVGTYVRDDGEGEAKLFLWKNKLWFSTQLGMRLELLAEDEADRFFHSGGGTLAFERNEEGQATELRFDVFGQSGVARRK